MIIAGAKLMFDIRDVVRDGVRDGIEEARKKDRVTDADNHL